MLPKTPHEPKIIWSHAQGLRGQPLHELQGRLDAHRRRRAAVLTVCLLDREPVLPI